jgi:hypothetical protein
VALISPSNPAEIPDLVRARPNSIFSNFMILEYKHLSLVELLGSETFDVIFSGISVNWFTLGRYRVLSIRVSTVVALPSDVPEENKRRQFNKFICENFALWLELNKYFVTVIISFFLID